MAGVGIDPFRGYARLPEVAARIQPTMQRLLQAVLAFAQASGR